MHGPITKENILKETHFIIKIISAGTCDELILHAQILYYKLIVFKKVFSLIINCTDHTVMLVNTFFGIVSSKQTVSKKRSKESCTVLIYLSVE